MNVSFWRPSRFPFRLQRTLPCGTAEGEQGSYGDAQIKSEVGHGLCLLALGARRIGPLLEIFAGPAAGLYGAECNCQRFHEEVGVRGRAVWRSRVVGVFLIQSGAMRRGGGLLTLQW